MKKDLVFGLRVPYNHIGLLVKDMMRFHKLGANFIADGNRKEVYVRYF